MNAPAKVKVCTPHGAGWVTEVTDDDFVLVELGDRAIWIHVAEIEIDRQQFSMSGSERMVCSVVATILAFLVSYWLL